MKKIFILLLTLSLLLPGMKAQEMVLETAQDEAQSEQQAIEADSLLAEVTEDTVDLYPDPEWYVAPIEAMPAQAPKRALAAASCPTDSVLTFDEDSNFVSVTTFEYDDKGRTICETDWIYVDGVRVGKSKTEYGFNAAGTQVLTATYEWDGTAKDWKGIKKTEYVYNAQNKMESNTESDWLDGKWSAKTRYTYAYDASKREIEGLTYNRNSSNELALSKGRFREYNSAGKTILDINYTAHNGTDWSAGTKEIWEFNASNLQTLHEKYTLANSDWTITLREIKGYDAANNNDLIENYALQSNVWKGTKKEKYEFDSNKKKTSSIVYAWSNGAWVNSTKEIWEFNGPSSKQTLHEKYSWTNNDWQITLQENTGFTGNNNTSVENYALQSNVWKGTKKEEYSYSGSTKIATITYTWSSNAWVYSVWTVSDKVNVPNESCRYVWTNDAWVGNGNRTLTTNNSSNKPIEVITQSWSTEAANWLNYTRKTTEYSGANITQEATYTWSAVANDWVGNTRSDWHYNAKGQNDTIKTYTPNGTEWIFSSRTVKTYYADGTEKMVHNAQRSTENAKWVMTSMTRTDIGDVTEGGIRQTLNASWRCGADSVWIGQTKDSTAYTASGKTLYKIHCQAWANNDWVPQYKIEYEYDESERKILEQRFNWNVNVNAWRGDYRHEFGFDEYGHQNMKASYVSWNVSTNSWIGNTKTEDIYGSNGQVSTSILFIWGADAWKPLFRTMYTYDSNSTPREIKRTIEQYSNEDWVYTEQYIKEYDGSIQIKDNSFVWLNSQWMFSSRNETYYDDDAQAKLRREITGSWNSSGVLQSFSDNHYYYACDPKTYTIRFENYDGELLASEKLKEGDTPDYKGEKPAKPANAQYTYTFKGWKPEIAKVTGDATYVADYDSVVNNYTIAFQNYDGTPLQSSEVAYGATPAYTGETPVKAATAQYTYTFKGWKPAIANVTEAATYTADFDSVVNNYTIAFQNYDGTPLQSGDVAYGTTPAYTGETPVKAATAQYTYSFKGWKPAIAEVTEAATYTADFDSVVNNYTIAFQNYDGTPLQSGDVAYGTTPAYTGETPVKAANAQYTYTFKGWKPAITEVTETATYTADFDSVVNAYTIAFQNYDGTPLQSGDVAYGTTPAYTGETPVKAANAQYTYSFKGWKPTIAEVTEAATYTADFDSVVNAYTIAFQNYDGTPLQSGDVAYGTTPAYTGETPVKAANAQYTYSFKGWKPTIAEVTEAATYTADFDSVVNAYTIAFQNYDGTPLQSGDVAYGATPAYTGETPVKAATAQYTYSFKGWKPAIAEVTEAATYTADYDSVVNAYTIAFVNYDGKPLQSDVLAYGKTPEYTGETPVKEATAQYTYTFKGWTPKITAITGDATYTADFDSTVNVYTITFYFEDGVVILDEVEVAYGEIPVCTLTPTKQSDSQYSYTFSGWDPEVVPVTGPAGYKAVYEAKPLDPTALPEVEGAVKATKVMINGQLFILRDGHTYTLDGILVE